MNPISLLLISLLLVLAASLASAQDEGSYTNPTRTYSQQQGYEPYLNWLQEATGEKNIPGAAIAIVNRDGVVHQQTWGVKNVTEQDLVDVDSVFRIASMSKTFAGTAASLLVEQQLQEWDTPLAELLPGIQLGPRGASQRITLKHIVSQSTGLMPHSYSNMLDDGVSYDRIKQQFPRIPTVCSPGSCYSYQNVVFSLVGDVVEESTGASYERFVEDQIFKPLGMVTASVGMDPYLEDPEATYPHRMRRGAWRTTTTNPAYYSVAPASGINASVEDMALWLRANLGAFPEVLSANALSELHEPVVATPHGSYFNRWSGLEKAYYAIGWRVLEYKGLRAVHHGGGVRGYRSEMVFVPEANIGMVFLINAESNMANDVVPEFLDSLISAI